MDTDTLLAVFKASVGVNAGVLVLLILRELKGFLPGHDHSKSNGDSNGSSMDHKDQREQLTEIRGDVGRARGELAQMAQVTALRDEAIAQGVRDMILKQDKTNEKQDKTNELLAELVVIGRRDKK